MIKKITLLFLLSCFAGFAQQVRLISAESSNISLTNTSGGFASKTTALNGKQYEDFSKSAKVLTMEKGAPALPVYAGSVIVPTTGKVVLSVTYDSFEEFDNVEVLPSKGSLKRNVNPADVPYEFGATYSQDAFYPGKLAEMSNPYIFRDTRGVTVSFYPYQYNPATKKLRLYKNISVTVVTNTQEQGVNEKARPAAIVSAFSQMYRNLFMNGGGAGTESLGGEMLIITPDAYRTTIAPLAQWKAEKGIKTVVATLEETGSTPEDIKGFIANHYAENPGLTYVLLVGDHEDLPSYTYGLTGAAEELWSDTYYAQLEGDDFYPEVLVGRFSGTAADVAIMVNRTLEYEMNPAEGDWMTKVGGIASNEGYGYGDDGQADWEHLRAIGEDLLASGYTYMYEFYDGSQGGNDLEEGPQAYMISEALDSGIGLLNYTGHGAQNEFVTGWYTSDDVNMLQNTGKYPFVISVACNNGTFIGGNSLCETFLTANQAGAPTGAIAACGSSILMAWAEPMQTQDGMAELITANAQTTLGGLFYNGQVSTLEAYAFSYTAVEVMQTWIFFGDPSVDYRNSVTDELVAVHNAQLPSTATQLVVQCNVDGALVVITQNGVVVGSGTSADGMAIITFNESLDPSEPLTVTATMQNFTPYQGTVNFLLGTGGFETDGMVIYPNPANDALTVRMGNTVAEASFEVRDMAGRQVYASGPVSTTGNSHTIQTSGFASGVYLLSVSNGSNTDTRKFVVKR